MSSRVIIKKCSEWTPARDGRPIMLMQFNTRGCYVSNSKVLRTLLRGPTTAAVNRIDSWVVHPAAVSTLQRRERVGGEQRNQLSYLLALSCSRGVSMVVFSDANSSELTVVGISAITEFCLALVAVHVTANRNKTSYAAKDPDLVVFTALIVSGSTIACCVDVYA